MAIKCEGCERFLERPQIFSCPCFFLHWKIVPVPSGFWDVSLCSVPSAARKINAVEHGLSAVRCSERSSVFSNLDLVARPLDSLASEWSLVLGDLFIVGSLLSFTAVASLEQHPLHPECILSQSSRTLRGAGSTLRPGESAGVSLHVFSLSCV